MSGRAGIRVEPRFARWPASEQRARIDEPGPDSEHGGPHSGLPSHFLPFRSHVSPPGAVPRKTRSPSWMHR